MKTGSYYVGSLGGAGLAFFGLSFGARLGATDAARLRRWIAGAALLGLLAGLGGLAARVEALTGWETVADGEVWGLVPRSRAGASRALGGAGLVLVAAAGAAGRGRPVAAAAGGVLVRVSCVLLGHAVAEGRRSRCAGACCCCALWGSLSGSAACRRSPGSRGAAAMGRRHWCRDRARLAAFAVPPPLAAGVALALLIGGGAEGLLGSRYGSALAAKASLVAALLGMAAWHRFRATPALAAGVPGAGRRLSRSIAAEAGVAILVLCAGAALVSAPPP